MPDVGVGRPHSSMTKPLRVLVEQGKRRTFACALDWPGLARAGRTEEEALGALRAAMPRYTAVLERAGLSLGLEPDGAGVEMVERVEGNATTDFGAPGIVGESDRAPVSLAEAERDALLVAAAWTVFEAVSARAPEALRKGPRGGGRDRAKIVQHVEDAERAYAATIGIRATGADRRSLADVRSEILALLRTPSDGSPLGGRRWPARYAARRIAWHALDHAWEIEDRSEPAP
jgi:hypothetical protein